MSNTPNVHECRRKNLLKILKNYRTRADFCRESGIKPPHLSQVLSEKTSANIGAKTARRTEGTAGKPEGWLDIDTESLPTGRDFDIELVVEAVTAVNAVLKRFDLSPGQIIEEAYQEMLRDTIRTGIQQNGINIEQVQHALFARQFKKVTAP